MSGIGAFSPLDNFSEEGLNILKECIEGYCKKEHYLLEPKSPYYEREMAFFMAKIVVKLPNNIKKINKQLVKLILTEEGQKINDEIDATLLMSGSDNTLFRLIDRNYPYINSKINRRLFPVGLDWIKLIDKLKKARKIFCNKKSFRGLLTTIVQRLLWTPPKMIERQIISNTEILDYRKDFQCLNKLDEIFQMEELYENFKREFITLSWIESTRLKARFQFFIVVWFDFLPNDKKFFPPKTREVIQKVKNDLPAFQKAKKKQDKYVFLAKYQNWYEGKNGTPNSLRKFFQPHLDIMAKHILKQSFFYKTTWKLNSEELIKLILDWHKYREKH